MTKLSSPVTNITHCIIIQGSHEITLFHAFLHETLGSMAEIKSRWCSDIVGNSCPAAMTNSIAQIVAGQLQPFLMLFQGNIVYHI